MLMPISEAVTFAGTRGTAEIDLELFTFVERYATTNFRWDLLLLFGNTPDTERTPQEVAEILRRNVGATTKELDDLAYLRLLVRRYTPERTTYRLTRRLNIRRSATRLANFESSPAMPPPA